MARSNLGNFSSKVIEQLRYRVNLRCSNPDCRCMTGAPGPGGIGATLVGEAAHIHAASPGGARFVSLMDAAQRRSIENAIWLCNICHTKIDRNPDLYSAALLKQWRAQAEESARRELGQKPPTDRDAQDLLATVLSAAPRHLARSAISNVIGAVELQLQALDPRILVQTTFVDGTTQHTLHAREPVHMTFKASGLDAHAVAGLQSMVDHGTPVTLAAKQLSFDGSPLLAYIGEMAATEAGTLTISPRQVPAMLKLALGDPDTNHPSAFDDMPGVIQIGRKSITFSGRNCGEILQAMMRKPLENNVASTEGHLWADIGQWEGKDLRALPYHEKLADLFAKLAAGWPLDFKLETEGRDLLRGHFNSSDAFDSYVKTLNALLAYSRRARSLAKHMDQQILFTSDITFSSEEHQELAEAVETFELQRTLKSDLVGSVFRCTLLADADAMNALVGDSSPREVLVVMEDRQSIKVFNQVIELPARELLLSQVVPKIVGSKKSHTGKDILEFDIEFERTTDFACTVRYSSGPPNAKWTASIIQGDSEARTAGAPAANS